MNRRDVAIVCCLLIFAAGVFLPGLNWGLPSGEADRYLFFSRPGGSWSGREILALAGATEDPDRGADVASHPSAGRRNPVVVNGTDEDRARIVRRYRLMSYQPDEWNTLKALSEMKPGQGNLDPKLYQYGGLWVYPVGAMLKAASKLGFIDLRADVAWYLDHPQEFGRFYIVARLWSVTWALVGVVAMYALVRRIVGGRFFPAIASLCFMFMPVVVNLAHEAKPHLAGAVLTILAVLAASQYVQRGSRAAWMTAGALCGAALGMVLSTLPVFLVLPAMVLLRRSPTRLSARRKSAVCVAAAALGAVVYGLSNPYVPLNFVRNRAIIDSNLGNSKAMYSDAQFTVKGLANLGYLIAAGTSPVLAIAGAAGALALGIRAVGARKSQDPSEISRRATGLLLAIPALCVLGQFLPFAAGKPGEFGRFLLMTDLFLAVEAIVAAATFLPHARIGPAVAIVLALTALIPGLGYVQAFVRDSRRPTPRLVQAQRLQQLHSAGDRTIAVYAEPAPYCLPPIDLFGDKIVLLPRGAGEEKGIAAADVSVQAVDVPAGVNPWTWLWTGTPISWADKPFLINIKRDWPARH